MFFFSLLNNSSKKSTRGFGLFESYLARKRSKLADSLIHPRHRNGRVLDIGCGFFPHFLSNTIFKEKHGVDGSFLKKEFKNGLINLKKVDIEKEKIPYPDNHFDTIAMLAVFEHISPENLEFVLKEIRRVLKRDGVFILTTPASWASPILLILSRIGLISKLEINDHKTAFNAKKIKEHIEEAGFLKKNIRNGYFELFLNMWMIAKK